MSRRRIAVIWILYGLCAAFFLLLQNWVLKHVVIWGVYPTVLSFLAVLPAITEKRRHAVIYAFVLGLFIDVVSPVFLPCFYTILLPVLAFFANIIARRIILSPLVCGTIVCGGSLLAVDLCHTLYLLFRQRATFGDAMILSGKEFILSMAVLPLVLFSYANLRHFIVTS